MVDGKLSIVMPAYNEADCIYNNLMETVNCARKFVREVEVILVDDGSGDGTYTEAKRAEAASGDIFVLQCSTNMGKGYALKLGTEQATGDWIAFLDADLDLRPQQLANFLEQIQVEKADVVIGSKMHQLSEVEYPLQRRIISQIYYFILRTLFRLRLHDTQTGIKLFRAQIIRPVMQKILVKRFAYDIEVLALCQRTGAKIVEAPVELVFHRGTRFGRMRFTDLWYTGIDTLAIFYRLHILHYYDKETP